MKIDDGDFCGRRREKMGRKRRKSMDGDLVYSLFYDRHTKNLPLSKLSISSPTTKRDPYAERSDTPFPISSFAFKRPSGALTSEVETAHYDAGSKR